MIVTINAKSETIPDDTTVSALISFLQLQNKRLAVEVNQELVPRSAFESHALTEGDQIEIVQAIGGG